MQGNNPMRHSFIAPSSCPSFPFPIGKADAFVFGFTSDCLMESRGKKRKGSPVNAYNLSSSSERQVRREG